ncbi:MAG: hypothetical protein WCF20_12785 [Methylovirgula sp.]
MRPKILTWLPVIGLLTVVATPAMAQANWYNAPYGGAPPSFYYQGPDGSYDSLSDLVRAVRGIPCGIECTRRAEVRWGMIPAHPQTYHRHY